MCHIFYGSREFIMRFTSTVSCYFRRLNRFQPPLEKTFRDNSHNSDDKFRGELCLIMTLDKVPPTHITVWKSIDDEVLRSALLIRPLMFIHFGKPLSGFY